MRAFPGMEHVPAAYTRPLHGMAATDLNPRAQPPARGGGDALSAAEVVERLEEEISRAERHGTKLACLLVLIENLDEMAREHGSQLPEQALVYVAQALRAQLRRFDRVGRSNGDALLVVLPGADGPLGEVVARRILERMQTIKVEAQGTRSPLQVSLGLAAWSADMSTQDLLARTRAATRGRDSENGGEGQPGRREHGAPPSAS
jgi:diguanylate cyclase (GGDEF)-like protein